MALYISQGLMNPRLFEGFRCRLSYMISPLSFVDSQENLPLVPGSRPTLSLCWAFSFFRHIRKLFDNEVFVTLFFPPRYVLVQSLQLWPFFFSLFRKLLEGMNTWSAFCLSVVFSLFFSFPSPPFSLCF